MKAKLVLYVIILLLSGCISTQVPSSLSSVTIIADGQTLKVPIVNGSNIDEVLRTAGIKLGALDRIEPSGISNFSGGEEIHVIRVREEFTIEQVIIPFERQMLHTESLPEQSTLLVQKGVNGLRETTIRHLFEDGVEISQKSINEGVVVEEAFPEIVMVGIQAPFTPVPMPGRLVYLLGGNAWIIEKNSGNRRPIITTGDLDGRIFSLSADGTWLLFTRKVNNEAQINSLWAAKIDNESENPVLLDLKVNNIIHFADWVPGSPLKVIFSNVEQRTTAPGWQANNNLITLSFSSNGWLSKWKTVLESNSGGVYGWWGSNYNWEPSGKHLAYARPDGIGLVDLEKGIQQSLMNILPLQTRGDWAWVPWISWSPNGDTLYTINHLPQAGTAMQEESQLFDLTAFLVSSGISIQLIPQTGMFAYPVTSPNQMGIDKQFEYQIAFLQAIFPDQSETSRYRLVVIDRDGSNQRVLFPSQGQPGLEPQRVSWSPTPLSENDGYAIAVIYQGNIYLVDVIPDQYGDIRTRQITGDGLTTRVVWSALYY